MRDRDRILEWIRRDQPELVASFGEARIERDRDGTFHLHGGSEAERLEASDWAERFHRSETLWE